MIGAKALVRRAVVTYSVRSRRRKASAIIRYMTIARSQSVALVGAVGSASQLNEAIIENAIALRGRIVAALDVMKADTPWPYVVGDGRSLPWRDGAVDLVVSNAVIEHVGDEVDQLRFVEEHRRVGRLWVITTPNRWFPIESHTSTLFKHWSGSWRADRSEFTRLLSRREFRRLLPADAVVVGRWWSPTFMAFCRL